MLFLTEDNDFAGQEKVRPCISPTGNQQTALPPTPLQWV
jgi:hypothetical protein